MVDLTFDWQIDEFKRLIAKGRRDRVVFFSPKTDDSARLDSVQGQVRGDWLYVSGQKDRRKYSGQQPEKTYIKRER